MIHRTAQEFVLIVLRHSGEISHSECVEIATILCGFIVCDNLGSFMRS